MLETIKHLTDINGFKVSRVHIDRIGSTSSFVSIDDDNNIIAFELQNGPTKEHGLNGASVNCLISAVRQILEGLNAQFESPYNYTAIEHLKAAYVALEKRKNDRELRGVYGTNRQ